MTRYAADTHAFVWYLQTSPRLSETARMIFADADMGKNEIIVPSIVLVEMVYLAERKRIEFALLKKAFDRLSPAPQNYRIALLDIKIARALQEIARDKIPEMPDRIIAATAKHLDIALVTRDEAITSSGVVNVVW
ncbi:MAG: type II toxin-antitoxin system VapC family toxin [Chloroflexi bacterium]|nr:type II toxin-antitoxin system VapC family toxin [Chloroflexota bacterium]